MTRCTPVRRAAETRCRCHIPPRVLGFLPCWLAQASCVGAPALSGASSRASRCRSIHPCPPPCASPVRRLRLARAVRPFSPCGPIRRRRCRPAVVSRSCMAYRPGARMDEPSIPYMPVTGMRCVRRAATDERSRMQPAAAVPNARTVLHDRAHDVRCPSVRSCRHGIARSRHMPATESGSVCSCVRRACAVPRRGSGKTAAHAVPHRIACACAVDIHRAHARGIGFFTGGNASCVASSARSRNGTSFRS